MWTKANEEKLERQILRKIFGSHHNPTINRYRIRTNPEVQEIYNDSDIVQEIKSQRLRWAGHVYRLDDERQKFQQEKDHCPRMRWRDNIKSDLQKMNILFEHRLMENRKDDETSSCA